MRGVKTAVWCAGGGWGRRTSLLVKLFEDFADNLANTLQRLDVLFGLVKLLLQSLYLQSQVLEFRLPLPRLDQLLLERGEGVLALLV